VLVHDEVVRAFPSDAGAFAPVLGTEPSNAVTNVYGARERTATLHHGDSGSAARFFYSAKADADRVKALTAEVEGLRAKVATIGTATAHGIIETPVFMPVGTAATVKGVTAPQLQETGAQMVQANGFHLKLLPGESVVA
jgi:hypothetical protein